ncbi:NAD(P)H nitroreductase [Mycobacterium kansasii]|uniref:NAD(P)H nitroreductase acg n=1 Tax=Mycobacterium attenuatum TaxID=2341086 RepID=A0A498PUS6_9MYCO|nr:NAD(P)H nitroreductase [Mycobacterium attenuatum]ORB86073.1 NAD(P)H nitroreductase [Mycobacterium kansasii]VBA36579.1 Putative NAD(P)H nitroreductase acg [Mycobacterium attenuatum]VBA49137.1 Putative NAD(P)H nitroreductase acg [Mycobacterium attenuatum]VBA54659.1 Putative NAD(P)H nitroreductase acg [Mycobacterium attenuatum]
MARSVDVVDIDVLANAVLLACRAPSVHNSQPWRWVAEAGSNTGRVHLFVDRHRTVRATDHSGREALISCGAALDHLRVAMSAAHWQASTTRFPDPNRSDHLATIEFSRAEHVTTDQRQRAEAILQRRTDRLPFDRPSYWDLFEPTLRNTVDDNVALLDVLTDDQRPRLVQASQLSEALRRDDSSYHAELDWWTSPFALAEGVPPSALASDTERLRVDVGREFPIRSHQERRAHIDADWSKILVLSTPNDSRIDVLRCGEMLSAVLLECTMVGMATCTLSHLIESPESRDIVRELIGHRGEPQVLVRVGITPPIDDLPPPTPRRPLDNVLEIRHEPEKG